MPFVSRKDQKQYDKTTTIEGEFRPPTSFAETFQAGVGLTIDEELSISGRLNREGWEDRREIVEQLLDEGKLDETRHKFGSTKIWDYDKIARDFDEVKTSAELKAERNAKLKARRDQANDIFDRGGMSGQIAGSMAAFMLDPISIATMPIAYSTAGVKGLRAVGQAMIRAGAVEMAAETGIQAFVFGHKQDIDSPYEWKDAIANIATAATGGALLAGGGVGIREYLKSVRLKARELPQNDELDFSVETIERLEDTLSNNPLRKEGMTSQELIDADAQFLTQLETLRTQPQRVDIEKPDPVDISGDANLKTKEQTVLAKIGQAEDFKQDMLKYKQRFDVNESLPNLKGVQINEKVRIKETGEIVTVKSDAETVHRRATKRLNQVSNLRRCLGA